MSEYCSSCGAKLIEGSQFCSSCGKNINEPPMMQTRSQSYVPIPKKSQGLNTKLLALIATAVVVIIVIAVVLLVFLGGNNSSNNNFIGKWRVQSEYGSEVIWTVYENGSVLQELSYYSVWGHWEQVGDQVCGYWEPDPYDYRCFTIEYSDGGNKITAYYQGEFFATATRIS
ncbi:MAG: zinc-ribbon domain-containing protein [Candidatus Hodarchaeales archaeon]|jgi:hypothetical protein